MMQMLGDLTGMGSQAATNQNALGFMDKVEQERIAEEIRFDIKFKKKILFSKLFIFKLTKCSTKHGKCFRTHA
jgi:hypothetical protein